LGVVVSDTPDNNYDLAYYEFINGQYVYMDWIIIGITNDANGGSYYEVFNWGNNTPDDNSNVGDVAVVEGGEVDDQQVDPAELYDPDGTGGPAPQSGILIDVDNVGSNPPPGTYNYIVIISPDGDSNPNNNNNPAQIDSIEAVEVPIPPTP
jgi:hypothetical protein